MLSKKSLSTIPLVSLTIFLILSASVKSTTVIRVVNFGGALNYAYSPKNFSAFVGDTVQWKGDFTTHPLSSTLIPAKAASWHKASGNLFTYIITEPGGYDYECDFHAGLGMTGSFSVASVGIKNNKFIHNSHPSNTMDLKCISDGRKTTISFILAKSESASLRIFTPMGVEISAIINKRFEKGENRISTDTLSKGFYLVEFSSNDITIARKVIVLN